ncbi:patatin-like phospholipase family protein [Gracilinema caldarium]|uniref:Patatin n=1 Tax=Gracilinema caldarium (strain ATCC 51460 / DSM 7334 / H1) TaxID=744872 RepID=F8F063_GRAC1|nr:patatin-like phospholipase family protein [Gracilinema caldarium]AEJ18716.1 Patatin [Gracilinema caldarium DSM 7334]
MNRSVRWALVLSGGGAKGFMHIGVLKALEAWGYPKPSLVVGTSMGAIVGGLYACGYSPEELENIAVHQFDIRRYLDSSRFHLSGPMGRLMETGQMISRFATRPGIDSGNRILAFLEELTQGKTIESLSIPFRCNAVDLITGNEVVFSSGSLARAMRASMAFPAFFDPLIEGSQYLVDGGLVNNLPVHIARGLGYSRVLAVDVGAFLLAQRSTLRTGPQVVYRALEVAISHIQRGDADRATLTLYPEDAATPFDFSRAKHLITVGEQYTLAHLQDIQNFFRNHIFSHLWRHR